MNLDREQRIGDGEYKHKSFRTQRKTNQMRKPEVRKICNEKIFGEKFTSNEKE